MAYNFLRDTKMYQELNENSNPTSSAYLNKLLTHLPLSISNFIQNTSTPVLFLIGFFSFISLSLVYGFYKVYLYPIYFSPLRNIPGPDHGHWLFGQLPAILKSEAGIIQTEWNQKYGKKGVIRAVGPFGLERLIFTRPKALSHIFQSKPYEYPKPGFAAKVLGQVTGYGLLTLEGQEHKSLRRFLNPAFGVKYLIQQNERFYYPAINSLIDKMREQISQEGKPENGKIIDMYAWGGRCLLDIIGSSAFGLDVDCVRNADSPLSVAYHNLVNLQNGSNLATLILVVSLPFGLGTRLGSYLSSKPWGGPWLKKLSKRFNSDRLELFGIFCTSMYTIQEIAKDLLKEKMAEAKKLKAAGQDSEGSGRIDILSLLVKSSIGENANYRMDAKMMEYQILTFLGAGHETTASGVAWTLWLLVQNPEIQKKLRAEVSEMIAINKNPDYHQVKSLKYLDAVIQESLRVRPPVPATLRIATQNDVIDGVYVPKGTYLYIACRVINTDIHVWGEDAAEFKPERWFDLPKDYDPTFSQMGFIAGPHHCIGRQMAIVEMKTLILMLIGNFKFDYSEPNQEVPADSAITMKPRYGLPLKVTTVESVKA